MVWWVVVVQRTPESSVMLSSASRARTTTTLLHEFLFCQQNVHSTRSLGRVDGTHTTTPHRTLRHSASHCPIGLDLLLLFGLTKCYSLRPVDLIQQVLALCCSHTQNYTIGSAVYDCADQLININVLFFLELTTIPRWMQPESVALVVTQYAWRVSCLFKQGVWGGGGGGRQPPALFLSNYVFQ